MRKGGEPGKRLNILITIITKIKGNERPKAQMISLNGRPKFDKYIKQKIKIKDESRLPAPEMNIMILFNTMVFVVSVFIIF